MVQDFASKTPSSEFNLALPVGCGKQVHCVPTINSSLAVPLPTCDRILIKINIVVNIKGAHERMEITVKLANWCNMLSNIMMDLVLLKFYKHLKII